MHSFRPSPCSRESPGPRLTHSMSCTAVLGYDMPVSCTLVPIFWAVFSTSWGLSTWLPSSSSIDDILLLPADIILVYLRSSVYISLFMPALWLFSSFFISFVSSFPSYACICSLSVSDLLIWASHSCITLALRSGFERLGFVRIGMSSVCLVRPYALLDPCFNVPEYRVACISRCLHIPSHALSFSTLLCTHLLFVLRVWMGRSLGWGVVSGGGSGSLLLVNIGSWGRFVFPVAVVGGVKCLVVSTCVFWMFSSISWRISSAVLSDGVCMGYCWMCGMLGGCLVGGTGFHRFLYRRSTPSWVHCITLWGEIGGS